MKHIPEAATLLLAFKEKLLAARNLFDALYSWRSHNIRQKVMLA
jgi:hypothetical protein